MTIQQMFLSIGAGEVPFNLPTWSTVDTGWSTSNNDHDATYSSDGYQQVISGALTDGTTYRFFLTCKEYGGNGGWMFLDTTNPTGTHPDETGGNSLGQRISESTGGCYGTYATANSVTAGQNTFTGWSSTQSTNNAEVKIEFVVNRTVDKVWMREASASSWLGGGDPNTTSSTATFLLPDGDTIYFGFQAYSNPSYANFSDS